MLLDTQRLSQQAGDIQTYAFFALQKSKREGMCKNPPPPKANQSYKFDLDESTSQVEMKYTLKQKSPDTYQVGLNIQFTADAVPDKKQMAEHLNFCIPLINKKLGEASGNKIELAIDRNAPSVEIEVKGPNFRSHSRAWESDADCMLMAHEMMHLTGLADEYEESDIEESPRLFHRAKHFPKYNCRVHGPAVSLMADQEKAFDMIPGLLLPHQLDFILTGGCSQSSVKYLACTLPAYTSEEKSQQCLLTEEEKLDCQKFLSAGEPITKLKSEFEKTGVWWGLPDNSDMPITADWLRRSLKDNKPAKGESQTDWRAYEKSIVLLQTASPSVIGKVTPDEYLSAFNQGGSVQGASKYLKGRFPTETAARRNFLQRVAREKPEFLTTAWSDLSVSEKAKYQELVRLNFTSDIYVAKDREIWKTAQSDSNEKTYKQILNSMSWSDIKKWEAEILNGPNKRTGVPYFYQFVMDNPEKIPLIERPGFFLRGQAAQIQLQKDMDQPMGFGGGMSPAQQ